MLMSSGLFTPLLLQIYNTPGTGPHQQEQTYEIRDIMRALLLTTGPVSTLKAVKSTRMSLLRLPMRAFLDAADKLEKLNLGTLVSLPSSRGKIGRPSIVLVKKLPREAAQALGANPDLCSLDEYVSRYDKPTAKAIGLALRAKIVAKKLVAQSHFI